MTDFNLVEYTKGAGGGVLNTQIGRVLLCLLSKIKYNYVKGFSYCKYLICKWIFCIQAKIPTS